MRIVKDNKLVKNIGILAGGTALAQLITFLATIYLTKVYTPEDFGLLSLLNSIISLLAPLSSLRYNRAITLSANEEELKTSFFLATGLNLIFFGVLAMLSLLLWGLKGSFEIEHYEVLLWTVPFGVLLFGFTNIFQSFFEKLSSFKLTSAVALAESSSKAVLQYTLNTILPRIGLLVGYLISLMINFFIYAMAYFKKNGYVNPKVKKTALYAFAKKHEKFPKYLVWSNMIDSASQNICSITFPFLFSLDVLGNFSIAFKIVRLPAMLISMATRRVYYPKAASLFLENKMEFLKLYRKSTSNLFLIAILPVMFLEIFIPDIFSFLFSEEWAASAPYAQLILLYVFANFINSLAHENMLIFGLQKQFFLLEGAWITISLILVFAAYFYLDAYFAVLFYAIGGVFMELMVFMTQQKEVKKYTNENK